MRRITTYLVGLVLSPTVSELNESLTVFGSFTKTSCLLFNLLIFEHAW